MCGISGIIRWGPRDGIAAEIERMTRTLAHRGPDGEGTYVRDGIAFGHRRLAIIDLESGAQPMHDAQGRTCVTHNGEIYNYRELRRELEGRGHIFRTRSDTEVILHAYLEWGNACVERLRGMFAFAIADFEKRTVLLARDPIGIKPLFYRTGSDYVAFASEISGLRNVSDVQPRGRLDAVDLFLRFRSIPAPDTIFAGVRKLEPGMYLTIGFDGRMGEPVRYWELNFEPITSRTSEEWEEVVDAAIDDSVRSHMVADVPFGLFLSGGIDSTLVALAMTRRLQRPSQAFAIGFGEAEWDELRFARIAAQRCGVELHTEILDETILSTIVTLLPHYGEPFGDSSAVPTWHLARLARRSVPMVLSGDGGDEAFAGYDKYIAWLYRVSPRAALRRGAVRALASFVQRRVRFGGGNAGGWEGLLVHMSRRRRGRLWHPEHHAVLDAACAEVERVNARAAGWSDGLAYAQYLDYRTYLPGILTKVDIAAMSHGLEVRTPFVDRRLIEVAASLPAVERATLNGSREPGGKLVLKRLASRKFADDFVHRRKQGFSMPLDRWFLPGHRGHRMLDDLVFDPASPLAVWFERRALEWERESHVRFGRNGENLWTLLVLALWLDQNRGVVFG
jgi:asparagine synthase (glutamine-hydrolysing)